MPIKNRPCFVAACLGCVHAGGAAPSLPASKTSEVRVARVLSVGWFSLIRDLDTSLIVFLRGLCSGLEPPEGGIVYGLFCKESLYIGKSSLCRTHCPSLAAPLTEHIWCLYRPGLKDANKPRYRLLRRKLW